MESRVKVASSGTVLEAKGYIKSSERVVKN
jgi:hypothetical protein